MKRQILIMVALLSIVTAYAVGAQYRGSIQYESLQDVWTSLKGQQGHFLTSSIFLIDPKGFYDDSYRIISVGSDHVVLQDREGWTRIIPFHRTEIRIYRPEQQGKGEPSNGFR